MMTHHITEIDKGGVAEEGFQGEQGVIFMQWLKRVIVENHIVYVKSINGRKMILKHMRV
jgi:hypothetical protein